MAEAKAGGVGEKQGPRQELKGRGLGQQIGTKALKLNRFLGRG